MIISIQVVLIVILVFILTALYIDDRQKRKAKTPTGKLRYVWDGVERRRFVRINADVPVKYGFASKRNNVRLTKTKNISAGGICATLTEKLSVDDKLSLEIDFPGVNDVIAVLAKGKVAWIEEDIEQKDAEGIRYFKVGIEFKDISPKYKERLLAYIKESGRVQSGRD